MAEPIVSVPKNTIVVVEKPVFTPFVTFKGQKYDAYQITDQILDLDPGPDLRKWLELWGKHWTLTPLERHSRLLKELLIRNRTRIPDEYKVCNHEYLYRGFCLSPKAIQNLQNEQNVRLGSRLISCWTPNIEVARNMARGNVRFGPGRGHVVLRKKSTDLDILINLACFSPTSEVLVLGNGLGEITPRSVFEFLGISEE